MKSVLNILSLGVVSCLVLSGCGKIPTDPEVATQDAINGVNDLAGKADGYYKYIPGDPRNQEHWKAPEDVKDFEVLYTQNCSSCHSLGTAVSASIPLDNPTYLAWIPREKLKAAIVNGAPGTPMPAWGKAGGGPLTEEQIEILVTGFLEKKAAVPPVGLPPYEGSLGNPQKGRELLTAVYGQGKAAGWENPSFLALVSNQYLRTLLVIGRPELGTPDLSKSRGGAPLSSEEISDVVAWLASKRPGAEQTLAPVEKEVPQNAAPVSKPKGGGV